MAAGTISEVWDGLISDAGEAVDEAAEGVRSYFGGTQVDAGWGSEGWNFDIAFGEKRVLSWAVVVAALLVGLLIGMAMK